VITEAARVDVDDGRRRHADGVREGFVPVGVSMRHGGALARLVAMLVVIVVDV
jgi:hypothetical protein